MNDGLGETMDFMPHKKRFEMTFSFVVALLLERMFSRIKHDWHMWKKNSTYN